MSMGGGTPCATFLWRCELELARALAKGWALLPQCISGKQVLPSLSMPSNRASLSGVTTWLSCVHLATDGHRVHVIDFPACTQFTSEDIG